MLYDLIQFIMFRLQTFSIRGIVWLFQRQFIFTLYLMFEIEVHEWKYPTPQMCEFNGNGDISLFENNEICDIENFVFVYQKNLFS